MAEIKLESNGYYNVDPLYQWDLNQTLYIYGVSVVNPIIHINNKTMVKSIVCRPTIDKSGVISVKIPNSLLQKSEPICVYICSYVGEDFKTYYKMEIPVKGRPKPADYTLDVDDEEVYSFVKLEQAISNINARVVDYEKAVDVSVEKVNDISNRVNGEFTNKINSMSERILANATSISTINERTGPWAIDENVGKINASSETVHISNESATDPVENVTIIPMINSGNIYLTFTVDGVSSSQSAHWFNITEVSVLVNDLVIYSESDLGTIEKDFKIGLTVAKGDDVKIVVKGLAKTNTYVCGCEIQNISLLANINTPYKYGTLPESLNTVTPTDILNTLLGV